MTEQKIEVGDLVRVGNKGPEILEVVGLMKTMALVRPSLTTGHTRTVYFSDLVIVEKHK